MFVVSGFSRTLLEYRNRMGARDQAGAIPFRRKRGIIEICLIRNKGSRKWKIPKGFVDAGETVEEAALKEAWEEAGLRGDILGASIGSYQYEKWGLDLTVTVYLMEVTSEADDWDEAHFRERSWAELPEAIGMLDDHPAQPLLESAIGRFERRKKPRN